MPKVYCTIDILVRQPIVIEGNVGSAGLHEVVFYLTRSRDPKGRLEADHHPQKHEVWRWHSNVCPRRAWREDTTNDKGSQSHEKVRTAVLSQSHERNFVFVCRLRSGERSQLLMVWTQALIFPARHEPRLSLAFLPINLRNQ